jgi:hypothetical protein
MAPYRPMLGRSHHASELQALVHGLAIIVRLVRSQGNQGVGNGVPFEVAQAAFCSVLTLNPSTNNPKVLKKTLVGYSHTPWNIFRKLEGNSYLRLVLEPPRLHEQARKERSIA